MNTKIIGRVITKGQIFYNKKLRTQQSIDVLTLSENKVERLYLFEKEIRKYNNISQLDIIEFDCWIRIDQSKERKNKEYINVRNLKTYRDEN